MSKPTQRDRGRPPVSMPVLLWRSFGEVLPLSRARGATGGASGPSDPRPRAAPAGAGVAVASKRFHADGGCVYATGGPPGPEQEDLVRRSSPSRRSATTSTTSATAAPRSTRRTSASLHRAMTDAVDPAATPVDYYAMRTERDDGGYLEDLVRTCQEGVSLLPGYQAVAPHVSELVGLYWDLQVHKHVRREDRVPRLTQWFAGHRAWRPSWTGGSTPPPPDRRSGSSRCSRPRSTPICRRTLPALCAGPTSPGSAPCTSCSTT